MNIGLFALKYSVTQFFDEDLASTLLSMGYIPVLQGNIFVTANDDVSYLVVQLMASGEYWVQVAGGSHLKPNKIGVHLIETAKAALFEVILPLNGVSIQYPTMFWDIVSPDSPQLYNV